MASSEPEGRGTDRDVADCGDVSGRIVLKPVPPARRGGVVRRGRMGAVIEKFSPTTGGRKCLDLFARASIHLRKPDRSRMGWARSRW